jgi:hypothetical protein
VSTVPLERESEEKLEIDITTSEDSTSATIHFYFTDKADTSARPPAADAVGSWFAGAWKAPPTGGPGAFVRVAITPLLGEPPHDLAQDKTWNVWSRVALGGEIAVDLCGQVKVK